MNETTSFLASALLATSLVPAAGVSAQPASSKVSGPPFDFAAQTPHHITFVVDTAPARDVLTLVTGGEGASAALKRLRESPVVASLLAQQGVHAEDFFGRLVTAAAGTPDSLLKSFAAEAPFFRGVLDALEQDDALRVKLEAGRIASMLPPDPPVNARLVLVPFLDVGGFEDVMRLTQGEAVVLVSDLPRLAGDLRASLPPPGEVVLKVLRASASEAWRLLFAPFKKPPAWPVEKDPDLDALLARTVAEGVATIYLFPDEFFPLASLLDEPISRSFSRWNTTAEGLLDPKKKELDKKNLLAEATRGEFWERSAAIVGAQMVDALVRSSGRENFLRALSAGPRSVATSYLTVSNSKSAKLPQLSKVVKKALESPAPVRVGPGEAPPTK